MTKGSAAPSPAPRVASIDQFRGLTIVGMFAVQYSSGFATARVEFRGETRPLSPINVSPTQDPRCGRLRDSSRSSRTPGGGSSVRAERTRIAPPAMSR
jgi:hypothetical protein